MSNMAGKRWEAELKQYEAGQNYVLQAAKINGDFTSATNNIRLDAAKVGAQVYAQLAASAYGMINASAGSEAHTSRPLAICRKRGRTPNF